MTSLSVASYLGLEPCIERSNIELVDRDNDSFTIVIRAAYQQVFGNAHLMDTERLITAESQLRNGDISLKGFIRSLAVSETYRRKFLYSSSQIQFIELNFKHLLGRSPYDLSEISFHINLYNQQGYEAEIDSYIFSEEYDAKFGDSRIPTYQEVDGLVSSRGAGFSRILQLYRGNSSSDKVQIALKHSQVFTSVAQKTSSSIGSPLFGKGIAGSAVGDRCKIYRLQVTQKPSTQGRSIRRTIREIEVPYEQLSSRLKELGKQGYRVTSIQES